MFAMLCWYASSIKGVLSLIVAATCVRHAGFESVAARQLSAERWIRVRATLKIVLWAHKFVEHSPFQRNEMQFKASLW